MIIMIMIATAEVGFTSKREAVKKTHEFAAEVKKDFNNVMCKTIEQCKAK